MKKKNHDVRLFTFQRRKTMKKIWSGAAVLMLAVLLAIPAMAAEEQKTDRPGGMHVESTIVKSTVEAIDYKTRTVTLKGEKGSLVQLIVGDEARNFNQVKKGDIVTFTYTEGVAVDVQKASEAPKMVQTESIKRAKLGEKPGGSIETVGFMTANVEAIDYKTRLVTLTMPEGNTLRFTAGDQVKRLNEINKGDEVVVEYMQKISIKVESPKKAK
jgi:DNA-binding beta-propeller fold protein YncE